MKKRSSTSSPPAGRRPPRFRSEAEESAWWAANQDYIASLLEKHGRPQKGRVVEPSRIVTIRLYERDIELARKIAKEKGIRYQSYIKMLLHEALAREAS